MKRAWRRQAGFTMVELVTVMVLVGVLAAIGIPRLMGGNSINAVVFGDQVASALRTAQKSAVAKRRIVCVTTFERRIELRISTAGGAAACNLQLDGAGDGTFDSTDDKISMNNPQPALFFRPDGTIAATAGGAPLEGFDVTVSDASGVRRTIHVDGRTGLVN
ncbi:MSHA pilin protein MshC [Massilia sp. UYP11]|uniref:pilus assembly FimT family protein n=1 Tax=Massilia sp. UYP11 TaxID=1756385 RepID=UPI003D1A3B7A